MNFLRGNQHEKTKKTNKIEKIKWKIEHILANTWTNNQWYCINILSKKLGMKLILNFKNQPIATPFDLV